MKKLIKFFIIISLTLVIGVSLTSCSALESFSAPDHWYIHSVSDNTDYRVTDFEWCNSY